MRDLLKCLMVLTVCLESAHGGEVAVQSYSGTKALVTGVFQVEDDWEVKWSASPTVSVTVLAASDGSVVAGGLAQDLGCLYVPKGGSYQIQITGKMITPWKVEITQLNGTDKTDPAAASSTSFWPATFAYAAPEIQNHPSAATPAASTPTVPVATIGGTNKEIAPAPPPSADPAQPATRLTADQARAVVLIKGDKAEGTGFLIKTADGSFVVTNLHVLSANPNIHILTNTGDEIKALDLQGASDRDLALIKIKDAGYAYLNPAADLGKIAQPGDEVLTPGNSEGGDVVLNTSGNVMGIGPVRIEFNNPIYHGNSGGPVLHSKSGTVLGVVTEALAVDLDDDLDKTSFASRNSSISAKMRYFGLRLDNVPRWDDYDWGRFETQTAFLEQFHQRSQCLDSYLNTAADDKTPAGLLYLADDRIKTANSNFSDMATGGDSSQRMEAYRSLIFELSSVVDSDLPEIQQSANFYAFEQKRARDEADYRKALKTELDTWSNDISHFGSLARRN